jgi:hypothetical protein
MAGTMTTDSSMPCCTSLPPEARARRRALAALLCAGLAGASGAAWAAAPGVPSLRVERSDDGSAVCRAQLRAGPSVQDALLKGIPVHFVAEAGSARALVLVRPGAGGRHATRVAYQPLTRRWRLNTSSEPINDAELGLGLSQQYESWPR